MKRDLDRVLKQALTPQNEPDAWLNQNILYQAEEMENMADRSKMRKSRISAAVTAAALTLVIGSAAVVAAARYLTPGQIARELQDQKLMDAFQGEDAVLVNETQEYAGYRITLLGAVTGRNTFRWMRKGKWRTTGSIRRWPLSGRTAAPCRIPATTRTERSRSMCLLILRGWSRGITAL